MSPKYRNLGRNHDPSLSEFLGLVRTKRPRWVYKPLDKQVPAPPERVEGSDLRITFINHMTVLIQTHGKNLLTDPIWAKRCSPSQWAGPKRYAPPGIAMDALPPIDAVLLSHDHYDHLCLPTLRQLAQRGNPTVFTGKGVGRTVKKSGLSDVVELDWWESYSWRDGWMINGCPAQHFSGRTPFDRNQTLWMSLWVQSPSQSIYFAGDTGMGPHFEQIRERYGAPDVSLLPIGAYTPEWFMAPVHMSPKEALDAHDLLQTKHSIATHFGTFALAMDEQEVPQEWIRTHKQSRSFHVLEHGAHWCVSA